jgi:hypothetical protein
MEKLVTLLRRYNSGVPRLFDRFEHNLAIAIDSSMSISTTQIDLTKSPLLVILNIQAIFCLVVYGMIGCSHGPTHAHVAPIWHKRSFHIVGVVSIFAAANFDMCVYTPDSLRHDFYCASVRSALMECTPGIGRYRNPIVRSAGKYSQIPRKPRWIY